MKTLVYIVTCAVMLSVISCTSRNKGGDDVQVLMKDSTVISAPQRMQVSDTKVTITYKGRVKTYLKPPLCKGRWILPKAKDGRIVVFQRLQSLSQLR